MSYIYLTASNEDVSLKEGQADFEAIVDGDPIDAGVLLGQLTDAFPQTQLVKVLASALVQSMYCCNYFGDVERNMYLDMIEESDIDAAFQDIMSVFNGS
jgi:hypothetical protein